MMSIGIWWRDMFIREPADLVVHIQGQGMVLREKSLIAYERESGKILAVGTEAEALTGRESEGIWVMSPLRQGMIADYPVAVQLFGWLLTKAGRKKLLRRPAVAVCVPKGITPVEKKAMEDAFLQAGARKTVISDLPVDRFLQEEQERFPDLYRKCKITVGITKEEPERYVGEALDDILQYAAQEGISPDRVAELLQKKAGVIQKTRKNV